MTQEDISTPENEILRSKIKGSIRIPLNCFMSFGSSSHAPE